MSPDLLASLFAGYAVGFAATMLLKLLRDRLKDRQRLLAAYKRTRMRQELVKYVASERRRVRGEGF